MLIILSPAKTLNFAPHYISEMGTLPVFLKEADRLAQTLRKMNASGIAGLMSVSDKIALLNYERYQTWENQTVPSKAAITAFDGDVYDGLQAATLSENQFHLAQQNVRILSGLYGVLKPLDLIKPHRLEMGIRLTIGRHQNLYSYWADKITQEINRTLKESGKSLLLNLASQEYFKSINQKKLKATVITAEFRDFSNGNYRMVSFYAKKARGLMTRFILEHRIENPEDLKAFDSEGYRFAPAQSSDARLVFLRDH